MAETSSGVGEVMPTANAPEVSAPEVSVIDAKTVDASVAASEEEAAPLSNVPDDESEARAEAGAGVAASTAASSEPTRRHRVKVAARDAMEGKIAPRVEKMRRASTVVLDEAADDPGLRFVLVAALLILFSLGLLLLSQILK
jgi:hypothetical protein